MVVEGGREETNTWLGGNTNRSFVAGSALVNNERFRFERCAKAGMDSPLAPGTSHLWRWVHWDGPLC